MTLLHDLRLGARALARARSYTIVAVLTLALGVGATTAIFSVIDGVLLQPLSYRDPERVVAVLTTWTDSERVTPRLTAGDYTDISASRDVFDAISVSYGGELGVRVGTTADFAGTYFVYPGFFAVLGVSPEAGRFPAATEAGQAAVVTSRFAARHFGTPPAALGQTLGIDGQPYVVVGILPTGAAYPRDADVWAAATTPHVDPAGLRSAFNYPTVARLRPDVSLERARARLNALGAQLARAYPDSNRTKRFDVVPLHERLVGRVRATLYLLFGAVSLVLLIACVNVSSLALARAATRSREMAVRAALGASRWRLVRQLATESLLVAVAAGLLATLFARGGVALLVRLAPQEVPRLENVGVHGGVFVFALALACIVSLLVGLLPVWAAARPDLQDALRQGGTRGPLGGASPGLRGVLVAAQIATAVVLAVTAGLLSRSFIALTESDLGYEPGRLLVMYAHAPAHSDDEYVRTAQALNDVLPALAAVPSVRSASAVMGLPAGRYSSHGAYAVEGLHQFAPGQKLPVAGFRLTATGYFTAMGMRVLHGRDFAATDGPDAPRVAIISVSLARESFGDANPIGRRLQCGLDSLESMTIVGVVSDVRHESPSAPVGSELYMPLLQHPSRANEVQFVLRVSGEPGAAIGAVRAVMTRQVPGTALRFTTMEAELSDAIATPRFRMALVSVFAGLALVLATVGVFGLMNYVAVQRTSELGLRAALGAAPGDLLLLLLRKGVLLGVAGLVAGAVAAALIARVLESMLFGVVPHDPATYTAVLASVAAVTLLASAIPAVRASRVDPLVAIRDSEA